MNGLYANTSQWILTCQFDDVKFLWHSTYF
jgi:hypothetical protein